MTLAQTIVGLMPKPVETIQPRWATVTSRNPLRIRYDAEPNPLAIEPVDLVGVSLNDRVWTQSYAGQVMIVGRFGGSVPPASVQAFAGATIPNGWLKADGVTYNTVDYPALAAALGAVGSTFAVPDLSGRVIVGASTDADFNLNDSGGGKDHNHGLTNGYAYFRMANGQSNIMNKVKVVANQFYDQQGFLTGAVTTGTYQSTNVTALGGTTDTSPNMPPFLALNWMIKT